MNKWKLLSRDLRKITDTKTVNLGILLFIFFSFAITVIRAATTQMTFDEAYTYLKFCKPSIYHWNGIKALFTESIANNHLLNTYLITLFDYIFKSKYCEFIIRLPSILFYAVYLLVVWKLYCMKHLGILETMLLTANYYLDEFFGLARGYAMAYMLVFLTCLSYEAWKRTDYSRDRYVILCAVSLAVATFANTVTLLLVPVFGLMWFIRLCWKKSLLGFIKKYWYFIILWFAFECMMVKYHMFVTQGNLFTGGSRGFFDCFFVGYIDMFIGSALIKTIFGAAFAIILIVLTALLIISVKIRECDFFSGFLGFLLICLMTQPIFKKGYICERELLPFYAFILFALYEGINALFKKYLHRINASVIKGARIFASVILILLFVRHIDIKHTRFCYNEYGRREYFTKQYILYNGDTKTISEISPFESEADLFYMLKLDDIYVNN